MSLDYSFVEIKIKTAYKVLFRKIVEIFFFLVYVMTRLKIREVKFIYKHENYTYEFSKTPFPR